MHVNAGKKTLEFRGLVIKGDLSYVDTVKKENHLYRITIIEEDEDEYKREFIR